MSVGLIPLQGAALDLIGMGMTAPTKTSSPGQRSFPSPMAATWASSARPMPLHVPPEPNATGSSRGSEHLGHRAQQRTLITAVVAEAVH